MKITIPRSNIKKIKGVKSNTLYVVICRFPNEEGQWNFAGFFNMPYTSENYDKAFAFCKDIREEGKKNGWKKTDIRVAKIEL